MSSPLSMVSAAGLVLACGLSPAHGGLLGLRTIILSGQPAPGSTQPFASFEYPAISSTGEIAFEATLLHSPVRYVSGQNDEGVWGTVNGELVMHAQENAAASGANGRHSNFGHPDVDASGRVTFSGYLRGEPVRGVSNDNDFAVWSSDGGVNTLLARQGDVAAGHSSARYEQIGPQLVNDNGDGIFMGTLRLNSKDGVDSSNSQAVWTYFGGDVDMLVRQDDAAPGISGARIGNVRQVGISDGGFVTVTADLRGTVTSANNQAMWVGSEAGMQLVAQKGAAAPGAGGAIFSNVFEPTVNDSGAVAFLADLDPPAQRSGRGAYDAGIWSGSPADLQLVARAYDVAPGTGGAIFERLSPVMTMNAAADVCFVGDLRVDEEIGVTLDNHRGLWKTTDGQLSLVARSGDAAPAINGAVFLHIGKPAMNAVGDVAFDAFVTEGDKGAYWEGIFAQRGDTGELLKIAAVGDLFDVSQNRDGSDLRTIAEVNFGDQPDMEDSDVSTSINDRGEIVFGLDFTDGTSGIFVAQIPAPSTGLIVGAAGVVMMRRRR